MRGNDLLEVVGVGLVGTGVLWEHLRGPATPGWVSIGFGCLVLLLSRRLRPCFTPLDWPLAFLMAMGGVSLLVTALPDLTWVQVTRLVSGIIGFYALVGWARNRERVLWAAAVLVVLGTGPALLAPVMVDWNRAKMVLIPSRFYDPFTLLLSDPVHPNIMAALMALLLPLPLSLLIFPGNGSGFASVGLRLLLGLVSALMGLILLLTKSRGGYIAGAVGMLAVVVFSLRKWWVRVVVVLVAVAVIGAGGWWIVHTKGETGAQPDLLAGTVNPGTWEFRQQVWQAAIGMLQDFPFTGVGMGLFNEVGSVLYAWYSPQNPGAHNLYFQVGVDLGIPGLISYLAVLLVTLHIGAITARRLPPGDTLRRVAIGGMVGVLALMTHGLVDITVWGTRAAFIPWLLLGLIVATYDTAMNRVTSR